MLSQSDEIKARLDIVEIIRQYLPLKASGSSFMGRCPFHNEKTPSFSVSPTKQVWHCFGCGRGGDLFSFIMEIEKLTFPEALRLLAPRAGVVLRQETGPLASQRNRILDALEQASRYYHQVLIAQAGSESARQYITSRGLQLETIKEWQIGYAPESWDDLITFLKSKNFTDQEIVLAGLAIKKPETGRIYNRFRGRIMFPLREVNGNVVGFTGRILPSLEGKDQQGKYVNSPQTMVYDKSKLVFGLDKAKQAIREHTIAIIVEGQMDCISAHEAGFANVVAVSGTALTPDQVRLLQRFTNRVAFAYDMDAAGQQALERGSEQTLAAELETMVISIPDGQDPDEYIRQNPEGWKQAVKSAQPLLQYYLKIALERFDVQSISDRRHAVQYLLPKLAQLYNPIERDFWIKKVTQALETDEKVLRESVTKLTKPTETQTKQPVSTVDQFSVSRPEILGEHALALLLKFPSLLESIGQRLPIDHIVGASQQTLYRLLVIYYNKHKAIGGSSMASDLFEYGGLRTWLRETNQAPAGDIQGFDRLALLVEKNFSETSLTEAQTMINRISTELKRYYLNSRLKVVTRLLSEFEAREEQGAEEETQLHNLLKEFKSLAEEIRQLPF